MAFIREPSKCPKCSEKTFHVIESRPSGGNNHGNSKTFLRRRRKRCNQCGYKATTYEITADEYEEYLSNKKIITKIKNSLSLKSKKSCYQCTHYYGNSCRLDIPELDAEECSYFVLT